VRRTPGRQPDRGSIIGSRTLWFAAATVLAAAGTLIVLSIDGPTSTRVTSGSRTFATPADYSGPVWFSIAPLGQTSVHVSIDWGPWADEFDVEPGQPLDYWMTTSAVRGSAHAPSCTITVTPATEIRVGIGGFPTSAVPVPDHWGPNDS
jgi:hypothetical protein